MENFPIGYFFEQKWECDQKMKKSLLLKVYFKKEKGHLKSTFLLRDMR